MSNLTLGNLNERLEKALKKFIQIGVIGSVTTVQYYPHFDFNISTDKDNNEYYDFCDEDLDIFSTFVDIDDIESVTDRSIDDELHISIWLDNDICIQLDEE